jgi:hypothetical protein
MRAFKSSAVSGRKKLREVIEILSTGVIVSSHYRRVSDEICFFLGVCNKMWLYFPNGKSRTLGMSDDDFKILS